MNSPEAIPEVKHHHLRRLERRRNFLLSEIAQSDDYPGRSYDREEAAALSAVLADYHERGYDRTPYRVEEDKITTLMKEREGQCQQEKLSAGC